MVKPVDRLVEDFLVAGADYITVHPESPNTAPNLEHDYRWWRQGGFGF